MKWTCGRRGLVVLAILAAGAPACDGKVPSKGSLQGWPPGEPLQAGVCSFLLKRANLYHSTEWHLEVELEATNTGSEAVKCGFSARAVSGLDIELTNPAKADGKLPPGQSWSKIASARENDSTGLSRGEQDTWVYVEVAEGSWPTAKTSGAHVTPELTRPPD